MKSLSLLVVPALLCASTLGLAQQPIPPAAPPTNLESGGLRPPDAVDGSPPPASDAGAQTPEKELEQADQEDSGRGLEWIWLNAEIGGEHVGLETFKADDLLAPLVKTNQTGLVFGAGVGARILVFTAGVRFRFGSFSEWKLWTLNAEGGLRIPIGSWEPYFTVGGGYASLGSFKETGLEQSKLDAKGFNARIGAGLDYYLSNTFSLGANLTGEMLFLSRSKVAGTALMSENEAAVYAKDGSSIGAGATLTAVAGLHF